MRDTGSITGSIEADDVEIHGHLDGKVTAQNIVIGATGTIKGDIEFGNNLRMKMAPILMVTSKKLIVQNLS